VPLTPARPDPSSLDVRRRYADGRIDRSRNLWIGIREDHFDPSKGAVNAAVAVDLIAGGPGAVLFSGNDFYSAPQVGNIKRALVAELCFFTALAFRVGLRF
jgi:hypothetical protein